MRFTGINSWPWPIRLIRVYPPAPFNFYPVKPIVCFCFTGAASEEQGEFNRGVNPCPEKALRQFDGLVSLDPSNP